MRIAAAQTKPIPNDTQANILRHVQYIDRAAEHGVRLLTFPEMSLTGYELERAAELSFTMDDPRLHVLCERAAQHDMIIIAGAPVRLESALHISSFIFLPDKQIALYTKQFLHSGEEVFFSANHNHNPHIILENERIACAICADITNPLHPANACSSGATLYVPSIFYTPGGIAEAYEQLGEYSQRHAMNILMANFTGESYRYPAAGRSAFWDASGRLVGQLGVGTEGLLLAEKVGDNWKSSVIIWV
ncbi:MAG: carbon-nitrogen hydrolase family protein [Ignavibacteria bacterium]|nr:carbon-nitrogen hydrolase family protein [Ignavibacteria bacterium]